MRTGRKSWLLSCVPFLWLNSPVQTVAQGKWQSHTDWELKPSRSGSLASVEWMAPVSQSPDWLLFSHVGLGGDFDHDEAREIELGIGYRYLYERWIWGGYAFIERRDSANGNTFNQLSFGFEALSDAWDARINGYLPDPESKRLRTLDQVDLTNAFVAVRLGQERALPGFDVEVGRRVATMRDSRVYGGGFYFFDTDNFKGNYGSRLRFETRLYDLGAIGVGSRLTLGAEVSYDSESEFRIAGSLRVRLPFRSTRRQGQPRLSSLERRMLDPVIRSLDDVTGKGHSDPIRAFVYNSATGSPGDLGVLNADDSGRVHNIVAEAREHSVFVVTGTVRNSEVIAVGEGQSFFGHVPDRSISVSFFEPDGGIGQLSLTLEGESGSIHGEDPAKDVFRVPANVSAVNVFENLTISGGLDGIGVPDEPGAGDNRAKVVVRNSVIENVAGNAIGIGDLSDLEMDGVTIRKTGGVGVFANSENRIRVSNSTVIEPAMSGLVLGNRNHVILAHTTIDGTGRECEAGIGTSSNTLCGAGLAAGAGNTIEAAGLDVANTGWRGLSLGAGNDVTVTGATLRRLGHEGIAASGGGNALRLAGVTVAEAGLASDQEGIQVTGHGNEVALTDVTVSGAANDGIRITGSAEQGASPNTLVFTGVRVRDARDDGIQIDVNNNLAMTDTQVLDVGGAGLAAGAGNTIEAAGLDVANAGWRGLSLGAGNDVTVTGATLRRLGHEGIAASGGGNALRLAGVTVAEAGLASDQEGIQVTGHGNEVALTDVTVSGAANDGIRITGSAEQGASPNTLVFTGVRVRDARDDGIQIDVNNNLAMTDTQVLDVGGAGLAAGAGNTIEAAGLDVANAGWRGLSLGAGNDVTVTGATLRRLGHEGIAASGGGNALRLAGVTVAEAGLASDQEGIQVTGHGNEVALTDVTVSGAANDGIRITGSAEQGASPNTLVFTGVRVRDARDDGIQIDVNNDVFMTDTRISDVAGDGMEIGHGNKNVLLDGFEIRRAGANGLSLGDENKVMIYPGTDIERNLIEDTGRACTPSAGSQCGAGLAAGSGNEIDVEDLDIVNSAWRAIDLRGGNNFTMAHVDILSTGYEGIAVSGGGNELRLAGVTVAEAGLTSDQEGIQVTGHGNEVALTDVTVSGTSNDGIRITGSAEQGASSNTLVFTGVRVGDTRDDGIQIDVNNNVAMTDTQVLDVGGDGLHFGDGNDIALNGFEIRNAFGGVGLRLGNRNMVVIDSSASMAHNSIDGTGSACEDNGADVLCGAGLAAGAGNTIEAAGLDVANAGWRGLSLGAGNDVTVTGATLRRLGHEGIAASGGGNALRLAGVTVAEAGLASDQEGIQVTGHGNTIILMDSTISGTTNDAIRVTGSSTAGPNAANKLILDKVIISDISNDGDGIHLDSNNELALKNSTFKNIDGRTILVRQFGNVLTDEGGNSVDILDCSVHTDTSGEIKFAPRPDDTKRSIAGRCGH